MIFRFTCTVAAVSPGMRRRFASYSVMYASRSANSKGAIDKSTISVRYPSCLAFGADT